MSSLIESLDRLVRSIMREAPYLKLYPASVLAQSADGTLDLVPDDPEMRGAGTQGVPIRHGIPGVQVEVKAGQRVRLGFDAGDPGRPFALLWDASGTAKLGTMLIAQNASTFALLPPQYFPAGTVGDAAALAAQSAIVLAGNTAFLVPITAGIISVS